TSGTAAGRPCCCSNSRATCTARPAPTDRGCAMRWSLCRQTHARLRKIVGALGFTHVDPSRIFCVRGYGSTSEAWARIWGLPTLWQQVLETGPAYVVEIIEPEFSRLPKDEQDRVLIHELLHIPRTFSGAIRPHRTPSFRITRRSVEQLYRPFLATR